MAEEVPRAETEQLDPELTLLSSDMDLALSAISRHIEDAEAQGLPEEGIALLKLQRTFVSVPLTDQEEGFDATRMNEAMAAQNEYVRLTGDKGPDSNPFSLRKKLANEERWRISGIDPSQYQGQVITTTAVESAWAEAAALKRESERAEKRAIQAQSDAEMILADFLEDSKRGQS